MKSTIKLLANPVTEAQHQINVIRWSQINRAKYPELRLLHHVPNGGTRDVVEGKHLKEQGVKPGVPDLDLPVARGKYHGLRIEMKTPSGTVSPEQTWWVDELSEQGYFAVVCHGWQEAIALIAWYFGLGAYRNA